MAGQDSGKVITRIGELLQTNRAGWRSTFIHVKSQEGPSEIVRLSLEMDSNE